MHCFSFLFYHQTSIDRNKCKSHQSPASTTRECKKDYTLEPIENLYGHGDLAQTYDQCLKTENESLDSKETERRTVRKLTAQKVQDDVADQFRKHDKFTKEKSPQISQISEVDKTRRSRAAL